MYNNLTRNSAINSKSLLNQKALLSRRAPLSDQGLMKPGPQIISNGGGRCFNIVWVVVSVISSKRLGIEANSTDAHVEGLGHP